MTLNTYIYIQGPIDGEDLRKIIERGKDDLTED